MEIHQEPLSSLSLDTVIARAPQAVHVSCLGASPALWSGCCIQDLLSASSNHSTISWSWA